MLLQIFDLKQHKTLDCKIVIIFCLPPIRRIELATHPRPLAAGGQAAERVREAVRATPLETRASGALEIGWILEVIKAAKVSGKELFEELERGGEAPGAGA